MIVYSAHNGRSYELPVEASTRCAGLLLSVIGPSWHALSSGNITAGSNAAHGQTALATGRAAAK